MRIAVISDIHANVLALQAVKAIASCPAYLITGDDDLLCLEKIERTKLVKPGAFLRIIEKD